MWAWPNSGLGSYQRLVAEMQKRRRKKRKSHFELPSSFFDCRRCHTVAVVIVILPLCCFGFRFSFSFFSSLRLPIIVLTWLVCASLTTMAVHLTRSIPPSFCCCCCCRFSHFSFSFIRHPHILHRQCVALRVHSFSVFILFRRRENATHTRSLALRSHCVLRVFLLFFPEFFMKHDAFLHFSAFFCSFLPFVHLLRKYLHEFAPHATRSLYTSIALLCHSQHT